MELVLFYYSIEIKQQVLSFKYGNQQYTRATSRFVNMLRNIIIMGTSGLVLFTKEFVNSISQPRLVGSLITAIIEFGQQTTGMGVCFIELSNVSISIVTNESAKIFCALFYDKEDGVIFGRLLCNEILNAFTQEYSSDFTQFGRNLKDFYGFHKKIPNIVRQSMKPIMQQLAMSHPSIRKAVLVNDREIIDISGVRVDHLSVLANLSSLTEICSEISECQWYLIVFLNM